MSAVLKALPLNGYAPDNERIAAHLREQADWMTEKDAEPVRALILVIEYEDGTLRRQVCGDPCNDRARVTGLLTIAAAQAATGTEEES